MTAKQTKRPREPEPPVTDGFTVLHRARMLNWSVSGVTCISACPDGSVFAAGYEDGKVEIFDALVYNRLASIPGSQGSDISSIAWAKTAEDSHWRLFAATLGGQILELSIQQLQPIASTDSSGGAVWCLRAAPASNSHNLKDDGRDDATSASAFSTQLAAACADGSVKLFDVSSSEAGPVFVRALPRVEGNALSLAWHPSGKSLVSGGSNGCMHVWDLKTGTEQQRITVGTSSSSPPCVWAVEVLPDGTLVSADQEGAVQFWDGRFGTLLVRHQQFVADVLTLASSPDGKSVWASGVDPKVALYQAITDTSSGLTQWKYLDRKQPHSHDVRALAALQPSDCEPLLVSGGNDGQIILYSMPNFLKQHPYRQSKAPQRPILQMSQAVQPAVVMQVQQRQIQLWQLGRAADQQQPESHTALAEGDRWDLASMPSLLATINTGSSSHISAAALAPDASALAAADKQRLRMFQLQQQHSKDQQEGQQQQRGLSISKVRVQQQLDAPVVCCCFSADSSMLFAVTGTGCVAAVDTSTGAVVATQQLSTVDHTTSSSSKSASKHRQQQLQTSWCSRLAWAMPAASAITASPGGKVVAVATAAAVELLAAAAGPALLQPLRHISLLGERSTVTAVQFNSCSSMLAVATAGNSLAAYDVGTGLPTPWSLQHQEVAAELLQKLPGSIAGLSFQPGQAGAASVLVYTAGGLCHLDLEQPLLPAQDGHGITSMSSKHRRKQRHQSGPVTMRLDPASLVGRNGRVLKLEASCLLVGYCSKGEVVLFEKPWQEVLQALLPPVYRHRYGM